MPTINTCRYNRASRSIMVIKGIRIERVSRLRIVREALLLSVVIMMISPGVAASGVFHRLGQTNRSPQGSTVAGRISTGEGYQTPPPLKVFKNRHFCGATVPDETLILGGQGALRHAVVSLRPLDRIVGILPGRIVLDNQRCAFVPHIQVATVGSELLLKNSDPILHTVHARLGSRTLFNVGLPRWRVVKTRLDEAGLVRIDCDVLHTWMSAAIVVVATPFYALSDAHGNFVLEGLTPGAYELAVWHERLGVKTSKVVLPENGSVKVDVVYSRDRIVR